MFCEFQIGNRGRIVQENALAYAVRDAFPVASGHTLIVSKRHVADYFGLTLDEVYAVNEMLHGQQKLLREADPSIEAYNIGMNCGEVAGQTVLHCHVHLIPRRMGDSEDPRGGVRHVIPGKGAY